MQNILLAALGVGSSTILGAAIGFLFRGIPHKWNDAISGLAAGIMLSAAILGLIEPAAAELEKSALWQIPVGIFLGAICLSLLDKLTPHLHALTGFDKENHARNEGIDKIILFVCAIALHNIPEGIAAGIGFADAAQPAGNAVSVAVGISLQNIPEGLLLVPPMIVAGISRKRAFSIAAFTGLIEVVGTFIGYFAGAISQVILPFALCFAGGTMLYVVGDEMIPETHSHGFEKLATYALLTGFTLMLLMEKLL